MNKKVSAVWEGFRKTLSDLKEQWRMFRQLWATVPADCRGALVGELIFNPNALRRRHHNEGVFRRNLNRRWR